MAAQLQLTKQQLRDLESLGKSELKYNQFRRLQAIRMKHRGLSNTRVANDLGISRESVRRWINIVQKQGIYGLIKNNYKRKRSKLGLEQWMEIRSYWEDGGIRDGWVLRRHIQYYYNLTFSQPYIVRRAKLYGIRFRGVELPTSYLDKYRAELQDS